jgi:hypothetical protein
MNRHLSDERLIELSIAGEAANEVTGRAGDAHLAVCPECQTRRIDLTALLDEVGGVAAAAADVQFSDERLARQQSRILQRIEQDGRPGRLIAFPAGHPQDPLLVRSRPASRWVAMAAAAGLVVGLLTGQLIPATQVSTPAGAPAPRMVANESGSGLALRAVSTTLSDDEFLGQVEAAGIAGPAALRSLDALTPRAWEVTR